MSRLYAVFSAPSASPDRCLSARISVRRENTLFGKIIASLEDESATFSQVMHAFAISAGRVYSAVYAYCRNLPWEERSHGGRPPILSPSSERKVLNQIIDLIESHASPDTSEIQLLIETEAISAKRQAYFIACTFNMQPVIHHVAQLPTEVSDQTVYNLLHEHHLTLSSPSLVTTPRDDAATASNLLHWFTTVYSPEFVLQFRPSTTFNADEIHIDFDVSCKVVKKDTDRRAPPAVAEATPGHLTLMLTISAQDPCPPPFFIIGGLKAVPTEV
jgi:hypothetical protein